MTARDQNEPRTSGLLELVAVMDRLRRECPWDREQTHRSLVRYLLEESHEVIEAIEGLDQPGEPDGATHLREELGDLLLQVYFHARLAQERAEDPFDIDDVARGIVEKMVRRHPHVFGDTQAADAAEVRTNWETIKAAEKQRDSVLDGIAPTLPGLSLADKVLARAERAGITPAPASLPYVSALEGAASERSRRGVTGEGDAETVVGEELLAAVVRARELGVDPELALRSAVRRFSAEVRAQESAAPR
ncbi:MazG family protein [Nocardioides massiliensis]|uniref:XTP/dITP diphosphohydrolase n=1 Tax=Nocardioides massiliensis TaxID=1325935 RepID=A0ABT9NJ43_9ACTN|nr:MazG family protein [Nocardioides massiliensis]MDP9820247.1 XTP/dITP diphosphohydrolase [Nocardioides massiliensis]